MSDEQFKILREAIVYGFILTWVEIATAVMVIKYWR